MLQKKHAPEERIKMLLYDKMKHDKPSYQRKKIKKKNKRSIINKGLKSRMLNLH